MIRERLVMLDIRPSEPINDEGLARQLGFGRTPVREALKRLEREPAGHRISPPRNLRDHGRHHRSGAYPEIRKQLGPLVAARAARTAPLDTRVKLSELAEEIAQLDPTDTRAACYESMCGFRDLQDSGNPYLEGVLVCQDAHATRI